VSPVTLGDTRGHLVDWLTQRWVQLTGRRVDLRRDPWLDGPVGDPDGIGADFFDRLADVEGLRVRRGDADAGLIPEFGSLAGPMFDPTQVDRRVSAFYERTAAFEMDAWAEWCGPFLPFGRLLAWIFSRRLQQLNVPLSGLETSRGMTSDVLQLVDTASGNVRITAWVRRLLGTGNVLYAGSYSLCHVPSFEGPCVRVVFPLPNGNAMVIMRPVAHPDGSFSVVSAGRRFGEPGFYFTVRSREIVWARYLRALRESIRVYAAEDGTVRADHVLTLWGASFLRLHYRLRANRPVPAAQAT
jgi:hypothetical protein